MSDVTSLPIRVQAGSQEHSLSAGVREHSDGVRGSMQPAGLVTVQFDSQPTPEASARMTLLSPRQRCVLELICRGMCNKRIARELGIAPETVKSHAKSILTKLRAKTRAEAVGLLCRQ